MMSAKLRIFGKAHDSIVDGPGLRFVLFLQGCPHRCPGCHNPESHPFDGGTLVETAEVLSEIEKNPLLDGVTLSGGEPFSQAEALIELAEAIKARRLSLWVFSGFTFEELLFKGQSEQAVLRLLELSDVLVDGRYMQGEHSHGLRFRGSKNQRILDLRKSLADGRVVLLELPEYAPGFEVPKWS